MKQHQPLGSMKRFLFPRSLRYQLLQRSLLIVAALLIMIGTLQYVLMKDFIYKNKAEALEAQLMSMPKDWFDRSGSNDREDARELPENERNPAQAPIFYQPGLSIAYIANDGTYSDLSRDNNIQAPHLTEQEYKQIMVELSSHKTVNFRMMSNEQGIDQLVVFRLAGPPGSLTGIIQGGTETASLQQMMLTQLAIFAGLSAIALAAGLSFYLPLLRKTLNPLSRMVNAVGQTNAGNLTERLPSNQGQQEIDRLADAYNDMLERLDISFEAERMTTERMRRFIADASHELRTPLTSIQGFLEVLLRGAAANPEQLLRSLNSMQLESKRINKLVADLLALAKLDQTRSLFISDTRLDLMIHEMEPQLQVLAGNRSVHTDLANNVTVGCDSDQLKQVLLNLFLNAVQHTDENTGRIALSLGMTAHEVRLSVTDNGIGIQKEHIPYLFERFYRSESSRTRKSGGAGLGLAITKSIVDAHGGTIEVASEEGKGSTFLVTLPL